MSSETQEARLKRLSMRAHRRGTREMDLILGPFAAAQLGAMGASALDTFEALLDENDQDLYQWITGQSAPPARFAALIGDISGGLGMR